MNKQTIESLIKEKWQKWKVKYKVKPLRWNSEYLRTADCHFCKKHIKESYPNEGFFGWAILPISLDIEGKAPEVCPDCLKKISNKITVREPRTVRCSKCGKKYKEKIYGIGYPGWIYLPSLSELGTNRMPIVCPDCYLEFSYKLGPKFVRGTWTDLTYPTGSLLTSAKMTQNQDNFTALAKGHSGAPAIDHGILANLTEDDHPQYLTTTGHDVTSHPRTVLKCATASHSYNVPHLSVTEEWFVLTGGTWFVFLEAKWNKTVDETAYIKCKFGQSGLLDDYTTYVSHCYAKTQQGTGSDATAYIQWRYLQSSPPYEIEHFIFFLLSDDGRIIAGHEAPDPPWYGNNGSVLHPFLNTKFGQKIILVNPDREVLELAHLAKKSNKSLLELIDEKNYIVSDKLSRPRGYLTEKLVNSGIEFRPLAHGYKKTLLVQNKSGW